MMELLKSRPVQYAILGLVAVGIYIYVKGQVKAGAQAVATASNPLSTDNLAYRGVNAVGDVLNDGTQNNDFSLGSWIADYFPSDAEKQFSAQMATKQ